MRVVAGDATLEPEDVCYAQVFTKNVPVVLLCKAGIPFLNFAQQAFLGREERAAAVDVNAAAFENNATAFVFWLPEAAFQFLICFRNHRRVFFVIRILGPAVELKIVVSDFAGLVANANGSGIAHPSAIGGRNEEIHGVKICL